MNNYIKTSVSTDDDLNDMPMRSDDISRQLELHGMGSGQPGDVAVQGNMNHPSHTYAPVEPVEPAPVVYQPQGLIQDDAKYARVVGALKRGEMKDDPVTESNIADEANFYKENKRIAATKEFAKGVDFTPGQVPQKVRNNQEFARQRDASTNATHEEDIWDKYEIAAGAGIDVETGAPPGLRATADLLGSSPKAAALGTEYLLNRQYEKQGIKLPDGVPAMWTDENTGELAYWRKDEKSGKLKPTLVNPIGLDAGDALSGLNDVGTMVAETAGIIGFGTAGALTGSAPGAIIGGGAGAAAGNLAANKAQAWLANQLGLPKEITDQITNADLLVDAATAAGFTVAAPVLGGAVRGLRNLARPLEAGSFNVDEVKALWEEAVKHSDELYAATGARVAPQLGEATGNPALMALQENSKSALTGAPALRVSAEIIRNRAATGDALVAIHEGELRSGPRLPKDPSEQGDAVKGVLAKPMLRQKEIVAQAERDQVEQLESAGNAAPANEIYPAIQDDLYAASNAASEWEDTAWGNFRKQIGLDNKTHETDIHLSNHSTLDNPTPIEASLRSISKQSQGALSNSLRSAQEGLIKDLGYADGDEFINLAQDSLDVNQLHKLVSHLKQQAAREDAGTGLGWKGNDIHNVIDGIEKQLATGGFVKVPPTAAARAAAAGQFEQVSTRKANVIRKSYEAAKKSTVDANHMFEEKAVKQLLEKNIIKDAKGNVVSEEWRNLPGGVRKVLFGGDAGPLRNVLRVVGANSPKKAELLNELNSMYKSAVVGPDGKFSRQASDNFLDKYRDHINLLSGSDSTDFIRGAADLDRVVRAAQGQAERVKGILENAYGKKLTSDAAYTGALANDFMKDSFSVARIARVRDHVTRADPEMWKEIQENGLKSLRQKLTNNDGHEASPSKIRAILAKDESKLRTIYGDRYVNNLQLLQKNLEYMETEKLARGFKAADHPPIVTVLRSILGPLHPHQRRITGLARLQTYTQEKGLTQLMTNPEKLNDLMQLAKLKPGTLPYVQAAANLGLDLSTLDPASAELGKEYRRLEATRAQPASPVIRRLRQINSEPR